MIPYMIDKGLGVRFRLIYRVSIFLHSIRTSGTHTIGGTFGSLAMGQTLINISDKPDAYI